MIDARRERTIERREWHWVAWWALIVLAAANTPVLLGWALSDAEMQFGGSVYNVQDANSYLANMRRGARGAWRYTNPYTPEDHRPSVVYTHYLLLGKLAAVSKVSLPVIYNLARLVCGGLLLGVVYAWIAHWAPAIAVRRIAFLLIASSGGLGWLLILLGQGRWLGSLPLDLLSPEAYISLTLYAPPHLALATACLLLGILWVHRACSRTDDVSHLTWRAHLGPALAGGAALALVAQVGAFYLIVPAAVLGLDWVLATMRRRRPNWRALALIAIAGAMPAPLVLYICRLFTQEPIYRAWSTQNQVRSLHPLHYLVGYAVLGGLALLGLLAARKRDRTIPTLPLAWLAGVPLLLALPLGVQRRLIIGAQVPLGVLAAQGLVYGLALPFGRSALAHHLISRPRYTRRGLRQWLITAVIALASTTLALLLADNALRALERTSPIYHPQAELAALDWLAANSSPQDTVLSSYPTGNYLPARAGNRVVLGLGPQSVDITRKRDEVRQFYSAEATDAWRQALLERYGVAFVWFGPHERALGRESTTQGFDPGSAPYLRAVYDRHKYVIYEVLHENP